MKHSTSYFLNWKHQVTLQLHLYHVISDVLHLTLTANCKQVFYCCPRMLCKDICFHSLSPSHSSTMCLVRYCHLQDWGRKQESSVTLELCIQEIPTSLGTSSHLLTTHGKSNSPSLSSGKWDFPATMDRQGLCASFPKLTRMCRVLLTAQLAPRFQQRWVHKETEHLK